MSNARISPESDCKLSNFCDSRPSKTFDSGATRIRFGSSIPRSISTSSVRRTSCGRTTREATSAAESSNEERRILSAIVGTADYSAQITAGVERIADAADEAEALDQLQVCARILGAESAAFISALRDDADYGSCRFMLACQPAWCQHYLESDCIAHDPWLEYAARHSEPVIANTLRVADDSARRVIQLAEQHGFRSAVLVPFHSGNGHAQISLLCLGSSTPRYFEDEGFPRLRLGARLLAAELHDWWMARIRRDLLAKARITTAELELLKHEYLGHGSKRIAATLHVSTSSINSRFQRMNAKLGVPNRRIAARLAAEWGLFD